MAACEAEPTCVGYAHSTAWCVVYGEDIHKTPGDKWTSDNHASTTITDVTKPNAAYICVVKDSAATYDNDAQAAGAVTLVVTRYAVVTVMMACFAAWGF
jgi:hypothetical protein